MSVTLTQKKTDPQVQEATIGQDPDDISNGSQDIYIDPAAEKRVLLKCDLFLVPLLTAAFLLAYLDRSNIGNAAIAGLPEDLGMSSQQLANAILFFYVTYVPFEIPGSLLVKKLGAHRIMTFFMLGWSVTCIGTAFMKTTGEFYFSRLLIGIFESGMYPAMAQTLTIFYTPREQGKRFSYLYLSTGLSGAFGGLLAFGLLKLDGRAGLAGWRWLYLVEGIISVVVSVFLWFGMPDSYANAKFLNKEDKEIMRLRSIKHDRYMRLHEKFDKKEVIRCFKDPKIWLSACIQFLGDILSFGISTFLPTIIRSFDFNPILTQILTVPIYVWGVSVYITISVFSDKLMKRSVFMIPGALAIIAGYAILLGLPLTNKGPLYFAPFLFTPGLYCMLGLNYVWMLNCHAGYFKRATAIGINMTCGNTAGLIIAQIFKTHNKEGKYVIGESVSIGAAVGCGTLILVLRWYLDRQNKIREALTPEERQQWIDEGRDGDDHPDYRFML